MMRTGNLYEPGDAVRVICLGVFQGHTGVVTRVVQHVPTSRKYIRIIFDNHPWQTDRTTDWSFTCDEIEGIAGDSQEASMNPTPILQLTFPDMPGTTTTEQLERLLDWLNKESVTMSKITCHGTDGVIDVRLIYRPFSGWLFEKITYAEEK